METALTEPVDDEFPLVIDRWKMLAGLAALSLIVVALLALMYLVGSHRDPKRDNTADNPSIPLLQREGQAPASDGLPVVQAQPEERKRSRVTAPSVAPGGGGPPSGAGGGPLTL